MYGFDVGLHRSEPGTRRRLRLALAYINFRFVRCPQVVGKGITGAGDPSAELRNDGDQPGRLLVTVSM